MTTITLKPEHVFNSYYEQAVRFLTMHVLGRTIQKGRLPPGGIPRDAYFKDGERLGDTPIIRKIWPHRFKTRSIP